MNREFPGEWRSIVERNVPYYKRLTPERRRELQGLIQVFLDEKDFEGCGGLKISDEIRLTVAAQACLLLLGRETDYYPALRSILVYPSTYVSRLSVDQPDGTVLEEEEPNLGESWADGYIILSWDEIERDSARGEDGRNLVLHEFAHQLDDESGTSDGTPVLPEPSMYADWARVFGGEYEALVEKAERRRRTLLDKYGAESPAEFFAVATECFFERPVELRRAHPELYEQLNAFYNQDPTALAGKDRNRSPS
jgi:Mlc titration factor MtfA (ptsG expression regulator)